MFPVSTAIKVDIIIIDPGTREQIDTLPYLRPTMSFLIPSVWKALGTAAGLLLGFIILTLALIKTATEKACYYTPEGEEEELLAKGKSISRPKHR